VGSAAERPRIERYSGRGPLSAWLRMVAARATIDEHRKRDPGHVADEQHLADAVGRGPDIEYLKARHVPELEAALRHALEALPSRDATILRLCMIEGLSAAKVGTMYRVSAQTIQRWIEAARTKVLADVRRHLREHAGFDPGELRSLMSSMRGQIDITMTRLLRR
jgi:RNA polymerase sigma-70 factor (ECF subfamily)